MNEDTVMGPAATAEHTYPPGTYPPNVYPSTASGAFTYPAVHPRKSIISPLSVTNTHPLLPESHYEQQYHLPAAAATSSTAVIQARPDSTASPSTSNAMVTVSNSSELQTRRKLTPTQETTAEETRYAAKKHYVPAKERQEHEDEIEKMRTTALKEKGLRFDLRRTIQALEAQLKKTRTDLASVQQDAERNEECFRKALEETQTELANVRQDAEQNEQIYRQMLEEPPKPVDEDHEMEGPTNETLDDNGRSTAQADREQNLVDIIGQQQNEIAALMAKLRPQSGPAEPSQSPSFPQGPPAMIPRFAAKQSRLAKQVQVLQGTNRVLPTSSLRPVEDNGGDDERNGGPGADVDEPGLIDFVTKIVLDVLRQEGVLMQNSTKGRRPKRALGIRGMDIKAQQAKMSKEDDILWKRGIRAVWRQKYSSDTAADFGKYQPATDDQVSRCNEGIAGPDDNDYTLDFSPGWKTCMWNATIMDRFTELMQASRQQSQDGWGLPDVSNAYITGEFYNHLKQSQEAWALWRPRVVLETMELETASQIAARVQAAKAKRLGRCSLKKIKQRKYERRMNCVELMIRLKDGRDPDVGTWRYFKELLSYLTKDGMSSEEEGVRDIGATCIPVYK
ncbi:hypothetical protein B0H12DRAFT_1243167, partial [Mycena haematopus]